MRCGQKRADARRTRKEAQAAFRRLLGLTLGQADVTGERNREGRGNDTKADERE